MSLGHCHYITVSPRHCVTTSLSPRHCTSPRHRPVPGLSGYATNPCPVAHFCAAASEPALCPGGRMRATVGAGSAEDCPLCSPGHYCPPDRLNVDGIACAATFECPGGSALPLDCRPSRYCPVQTGVGRLCLEGHYCENSTGSAPPVCPFPTYCPAASNRTLLCPLGYRASLHAQLRVSRVQSCRVCPPGFYGNHPERLYCEPCPAGYYCPSGASFPREFPCERGHYCPANSSAPTPCPAGMYSNVERSKVYDDCAKCPENTYNNERGQKACKVRGGGGRGA